MEDILHDLGCVYDVVKQSNTPWKINMELTNHPFRKENLHDYGPC